MEVYRRPYREPGASRMPTLQWPREIPFASGPADNVALIEEYRAWLAASDVPKLFVNGEPGAILTGDRREFVRSLPNQTEVTVEGPALHPGGVARRDRARTRGVVPGTLSAVARARQTPHGSG